MSEFLDELARSLAKPMPRSRALRLLGGAVAAAAVPSLRTSPARGASRRPARVANCGDNPCTGSTPVICDCPSPVNPKVCFHACGAEGCTCCCYPDAQGNTGANCCPPGYRCGHPGEASCVLCAVPCGSGCCKSDEYCADKSTSLCCLKGNQPCGDHCCGPKQVCLDASRSLCCKAGERACESYRTAGQTAPTVAVCCPAEPKGYCARDASAAKCCPRPSVLCNGECCERPKQCLPGKKGKLVCKCTSKEEPCGDTCCAEGKKCCPDSSHCCPTGETCCGETFCCKSGEHCAPQSFSRALQDVSPASARTIGPKVCCRGSAFTGTRCCPPGEIAVKRPGGGLQCAPLNKG
jgi:hypothetical protein